MISLWLLAFSYWVWAITFNQAANSSFGSYQDTASQSAENAALESNREGPEFTRAAKFHYV